MAQETIVCTVCGKEFIYTDGERIFLEGLLKEKKIPEIVVPKKCLSCRSQFRKTKRLTSMGRPRFPAALPAAPPEPSIPVIDLTPKAPEHSPGCMCPRCGDQSGFLRPRPTDHEPTPVAPPAPLPPLAPVPGAPTAEEIVILVASDFEALVCREDVVWRQGNRKITIRLADIGPAALKKAMEAAVLHWWKS